MHSTEICEFEETRGKKLGTRSMAVICWERIFVQYKDFYSCSILRNLGSYWKYLWSLQSRKAAMAVGLLCWPFLVLILNDYLPLFSDIHLFNKSVDKLWSSNGLLWWIVILCVPVGRREIANILLISFCIFFLFFIAGSIPRTPTF